MINTNIRTAFIADKVAFRVTAQKWFKDVYFSKVIVCPKTNIEKHPKQAYFFKRKINAIFLSLLFMK